MVKLNLRSRKIVLKKVRQIKIDVPFVKSDSRTIKKEFVKKFKETTPIIAACTREQQRVVSNVSLCINLTMKNIA